MAKGISIREFARREGVSDTLVRRALKQGRLKAFADKSMNPKHVGTPWREGNATGANKGSHKPANTALPGSHASGSHSREIGREETPAAAAKRIIDESGVPEHDYAEALRRKENFLALLRELEYKQKSGSLVELSTATAVLFDEFRAQRDAWLNWPTKVGPLLAADLGLEADKVTEALTTHVHKQIAELGEPGADFDGGKR